MCLVIVVSPHANVGLSFPLSQQEEEWVTWTEQNFSIKPRELRVFIWPYWSLDIWLRTIEGFAGKFDISGLFQVATLQKGPKLEVHCQNFGCLSTRDAGEKLMWSSACESASGLPAPEQSLMDRGAHLPLHCELLSIVFKTGTHRDAHTNIYI